MATRSPSVLIDEARARVDAGDLVGAACYAREAARRALRDTCERHDCLPSGRTPQQLAKALVLAGVFTSSRAETVVRLDYMLNKASRLYCFRPNRMRRAIEAAQAMIGEPAIA